MKISKVLLNDLDKTWIQIWVSFEVEYYFPKVILKILRKMRDMVQGPRESI